MIISYEEFLKLIPADTKKFILNVAQLYANYENKNIKMDIDKIENEIVKKFMIMIFCLSKDDKYRNILIQCGLNAKNIENLIPTSFTKYDIDSSFFEKNFKELLISEEKNSYLGLTPLDILIKVANKLKNTNYDIFLAKNFLYNSFSDFLNELKKTNDAIHQKIDYEIKDTIFEKANIDVIKYLETAEIINSIIHKTLNQKNNFLAKDIVPISLLIAIFYTDTKETKIIKDMLKNDLGSLETILSKLNIRIDDANIKNNKPNYLNLRQEYIMYFHNDSSESILNIFSKIFNRDFTDSFIIENLFSSLDVSITEYNNIEKKIENHLHQQFFKDLNKEVADYFTFALKAFTYLNKIIPDNYENNFLVNKKDIIIFSFYLASVRFNTNLNIFFCNNNIPFDSIIKLLNLNIDLTAIETTKLDINSYNSDFLSYVYGGANENSNSSNIVISRIEKNITNFNFSNSHFLHNIFEHYTGIKLNKSFYDDILDNIREKKKQDDQTIKENYFKDLPTETMYFLEQILQLHNSYKPRNKITNDDYAIITILLSIFDSNNKLMKDFLIFLGFDKDKIKNFINIYYPNDSKANIHDLINFYDKFIFGGNNKEKKKEDITVLSIIKNIFNESFDDSIFINKFFDYFNLGHDTYNNFDQLYQEFLEEYTKKEKTNSFKKKINSLFSTQKDFLLNVLKIHSKLKKYNISDIKELSILLSIFYSNHHLIKFLDKNNFTKEKIFDYYNLPQNFFDDLNEYQIDYDLYEKYYQDLFSYDYSDKEERNIKNIFKSPQLKLMIEKLGINYDILLKEITTEQDYESSLTIDERIKLLTTSPIDSINLNDIQSVIKYGQSLNFHTKYIYDELPKLVINDGISESVNSINETLGKIFSLKQKEERTKSLFERLFAIEVTEKPEIVLNPLALEELNEKINKSIKKLSDDLLTYNLLRKYIEAYRQKNDFYLIKISELIDELLKEVNELDPNNENQYAEFLSSSSNLQIMKNKLERFRTSKILMNQELVKVNQAIVNHFITINALEMAKDDLLPLISAELMISKGRETENQSLEITQNIFELFQALLEKNAEATSRNVELLKNSVLPSETLEILNKDIEAYLKSLNQSSQISSPCLILPEIEKQKKLKGPSQS